LQRDFSTFAEAFNSQRHYLNHRCPISVTASTKRVFYDQGSNFSIGVMLVTDQTGVVGLAF
jgi:hypothetical protein